MRIADISSPFHLSLPNVQDHLRRDNLFRAKRTHFVCRRQVHPVCAQHGRVANGLPARTRYRLDCYGGLRFDRAARKPRLAPQRSVGVGRIVFPYRDVSQTKALRWRSLLLDRHSVNLVIVRYDRIEFAFCLGTTRPALESIHDVLESVINVMPSEFFF